MSFDCTKCKYGYHKFGFVCGKGIMYITKNYNKEVDCLAFEHGNTKREKKRDVLIENIKALVK